MTATKCECGYRVNETPCGDVITVVHCPLHAASPTMLEALYEAAEMLDSVLNRYRIAGEMDKVDAMFPTIHKIDAAIKLAEEGR